MGRDEAVGALARAQFWYGVAHHAHSGEGADSQWRRMYMTAAQLRVAASRMEYDENEFHISGVMDQ